MHTLPIFLRKPGFSSVLGILRHSLKHWIHEVFWIPQICHGVGTDLPLLNPLTNLSLFDLIYQQHLLQLITPSSLIHCFVALLASPAPHFLGFLSVPEIGSFFLISFVPSILSFFFLAF